VSVAPVVSPEGLRVVVDGTGPPWGSVRAAFADRPGRAGAALSSHAAARRLVSGKIIGKTDSSLVDACLSGYPNPFVRA